MLTAQACTALLLHGELAEDTTLLLADPDGRNDVAARLASCGLSLARRGGYWSAVAPTGPPDPGDHRTWRVDADEAVILLAFLALARRTGGARVMRADLIAAVSPRLWSARRIDTVVLGRLVNRRFLTENGAQLHAGPRFVAIDSPRARELLSDLDDLLEPIEDA